MPPDIVAVEKLVSGALETITREEYYGRLTSWYPEYLVNNIYYVFVIYHHEHSIYQKAILAAASGGIISTSKLSKVSACW